MRLSGILLAILNAITGLIGLALLGAGIWLSVKHDQSDCARWLRWPAIGAGAFIAVVSLAGLWGALGRVRWLLWLYLLVVFVLILGVIAIGVASIVMTNKGVGHAVSGRGFEEYRLGDYTTWLQRQISKSANWKKIKSCLVDAKVCKSITTYTSLASFDGHVSSIQSGCCKPPIACNMTYLGGTEWNVVTSSNMTADGDCTLWNNDASKLCYNCDSCKAGVLHDIKDDWKRIAIFDAALLVLLILVFSLGCCAFKHRPDRRRANPPPGFYVKA